MSEPDHRSLEVLSEAVDQLADEVGPRGTPLRSRDLNLRWSAIDRNWNVQLPGRRVLAVGYGANEDALRFATRGAQYVLACEPPDAAPCAKVPEPDHESKVAFRRDDWKELHSDRDGVFDVVHCDDLLHRVLEPMNLLCTLRRMTASDGTLLIGSAILDQPEHSEFLRFIPDRHAGDTSWWFVPGRLAFRWLVETAGFEVQDEFGETEGPGDGFPVVAGYLRARASSEVRP